MRDSTLAAVLIPKGDFLVAFSMVGLLARTDNLVIVKLIS